MKNVRKAKTSEFRFSITELAPAEACGCLLLQSDSKKTAKQDEVNSAGKTNPDSKCNHSGNTSEGNTSQSLTAKFKVLLGNGTDGAMLDLDTFLRVQQWVEETCDPGLIAEGFDYRHLPS